MSRSQGPDLGPITLCPTLSDGLPLSANKSIAYKYCIFKEREKISGFLFCLQGSGVWPLLFICGSCPKEALMGPSARCGSSHSLPPLVTHKNLGGLNALLEIGPEWAALAYPLRQGAARSSPPNSLDFLSISIRIIPISLKIEGR